MGQNLIETLEDRRLMSAVLESVDSAPQSVFAALTALPIAKAALPKVSGTFTGTSKSVWGDSIKIVLKITGCNAKGEVTAVMTSPSDRRFSLSARGLISANRTLKFTFSGRDSDGKITGKATGTLSRDGRTYSGSYMLTNRDDRGRFTYRK